MKRMQVSRRIYLISSHVFVSIMQSHVLILLALHLLFRST
jgi:hypothetical protein